MYMYDVLGENSLNGQYNASQTQPQKQSVLSFTSRLLSRLVLSDSEVFMAKHHNENLISHESLISRYSYIISGNNY